MLSFNNIFKVGIFITFSLALGGSHILAQQQSQLVTYLMRDGYRAICPGELMVRNPSPGHVSIQCSTKPSANEILTQLREPIDSEPHSADVPADVSADEVGKQISVTLAWDAPTGFVNEELPYDPSYLSHYTLYVCDAPIVAGGSGQDNPLISPVSCDGNLQSVDINETQVNADYTVLSSTGTLHFRVSTTTIYDIEGPLSEELTFDYALLQFKAIVNFRIIGQVRKPVSP